MADTLETKISNSTTTDLTEYRGYINALKNKYMQTAHRMQPAWMTIDASARATQSDMSTLKDSVKNVSSSTKKMREAGVAEAKKMLSNVLGDSLSEKIVDNVQLADPVKSIKDYKEFQESKPQGILDAERIARTEVEEETINSRVGTTEPSPNAKPFGYADNFKDKKAALELLKTCIPCEFRKIKFSAEFGLPWANTLDDLKKKWKDLLKLLKDLTAFQSGEFSKDLCNLFKFLDGQCLPDILGLMSLLSLMQLKYMDMSFTGLNNIVNQLLTPFLSPVIGSFTTNLDQFSDLIVGPLKCIVGSLEYQINNLQTQINGAFSIANKNKTNYYKQELDFIDKKAKVLRNRYLELTKEQATLEKEKSILNTNKNGRTTVAKSSTRLDDTTINTTIVGNNTFGAFDITPPEGLVTTREQELNNILDPNETSGSNSNPKSELKRLDKRRKELLTLIQQSSGESSRAVDFSKATTMTDQTRYALNNMEKAYKSTLSDLVDAVNDGVGLIQQSISVYREEFQRLLLGRINTQEDQIEFTKTLQKIARLTSIVGAVKDFKKAGKNLKKMCEQGNGTAMSQVAKQLKDSNAGMFDFYEAQDSDGNSLMVIAPGGARLIVNGIDFDKLGDDSLIGDTTLDSIKTSVSFNDLNEVDKLNKEGILPNLGNIDSKIIELDNGFKQGSELDLHFKQSYAIISNEFCSKSAIDFGSSDTVKQWAANLWQKE